MLLYRAVSNAECQEAIQLGELRTIPGATEGKWFAENLNDARLWGLWFTGITGVAHDKILVVSLSDRIASQLFRLTMLDNIGPARFADASELVEFEIFEVRT